MILLLLVACLAAALILPAAAGAVEVTVDSVEDQPDAAVGSGGCATTLGKCTLRAAIEEINAPPAGSNRISFDETVFDGEVEDTIVVGATPLPRIERIVQILAGSCETDAGLEGPCAGVEGPSDEVALEIVSPFVVFEGLAVTGAGTGIAIAGDGNDYLKVHDSWIGIALDGSEAGNGTGIHVGLLANEAQLLDNVIAANEGAGIHIEGSVGAEVFGNYIGVLPGSGAVPAPNGTDVEITGSAAAPTVHTSAEIGDRLTEAQLATPVCDGRCNVIGGSIDMSGEGEDPAPVSLSNIRGNHIGINAAGTAGLPYAGPRVVLGEGATAKIGGPEVGEDNFFSGGTIGVLTEGGSADLRIERNLFGLDAGGAPTLPPPSVAAIDFDGSDVPVDEDRPAIRLNRIAMEGGTGIVARGQGTTIELNEIMGADLGIRATGDNDSIGQLVKQNQLERQDEAGIVLENDSNRLVDNHVIESDGPGIRVDGAVGNVIGGEKGIEENILLDNGGAGIEVVGPKQTAVEILRNRGNGNGGSFIDLGGDGGGNGQNGPNDGIQAPQITTVLGEHAAGGGARPGAMIRVFRKQTTAAGEVMLYLGRGEADQSGNWTIPFEDGVPGDEFVAVTQTDLGGRTSELSAPVQVGTEPLHPDPPRPDDGDGPGPVSPQVPQTKIVKGPKGKTAARTVSFGFTADVPGSTFQCKLDKGKFKKCRSPRKYRNLKPGRHVFRVRAVGPTGLVDPAPAKRKFTVAGP